MLSFRTQNSAAARWLPYYSFSESDQAAHTNHNSFAVQSKLQMLTCLPSASQHFIHKRLCCQKYHATFQYNFYEKFATNFRVLETAEHCLAWSRLPARNGHMRLAQKNKGLNTTFPIQLQSPLAAHAMYNYKTKKSNGNCCDPFFSGNRY